MIENQPKNTMPRIDAVWAFVSVDPNDGNEGVIAFQVHGLWMPLIAADPARVENLRPIAAHIAKEQKITVKLVKFTTREELETIIGGN